MNEAETRTEDIEKLWAINLRRYFHYDGRRLAELMIEHGIGVAQEHAYHIKKIDSDYFEEV